MNRKLVIAVEGLEDELREFISATVATYGFETRSIPLTLGPDDLAFLHEAEVFFTQKPTLLSECGENLRWLQLYSAGVNQFLEGGAAYGMLPEGVLLSNNTGAFGNAISEHVIMQLLMLWRGEWIQGQNQAARQWGSILPQKTIEGSTMCMLGCGDIGTACARKLRLLGAKRIIGVSRSGVARTEGIYDEMHKLNELDAVLPLADALVMSLPGTADATHVLNAGRIALMRNDAVVANVGRGSAIDQEALVAALNTGELGGAALDVVEPEPLPADSPLWDARNCIITPHVAGNMSTAVTRRNTVELFCKDFESYVETGKPIRLVDLSRGY